MKKIALISALMLSTIAVANDYEVTPLVGYNIAEGNLNLSNYAIVGGEVQYNGFNFPIKPEISFLYSMADYENDFINFTNNADTNVMRFLLNGVYEFNKIGPVTPLVKAGIGYETMDDAYGGNNDGSGVADIGAGVKYPFNDMLSLKLEALYMAKYNAARYDSNLAILAGITIAFGGNETAVVETKTVVEEPTPVVEKIVEPIIEEPVIAEVEVIEAAPVVAEVAAVAEVKYVPEQYEGTIEVDEKGDPKKINLGVSFQKDTYNLDTSYNDNIDKFVDYLNRHPEYKVEIVGFADSVNTYAYNQALSEKRANLVKEMLVNKGISADRLNATGKGEYNPIATNMYKAGRAQNRRVEVTLVK